MKIISNPKIIYQVDAFTDQPFRGNPAGVCILEEEMPEEWMQNMATEMNLSETAFIFQEEKKFRIRYFTPEVEVPLCGHATLSSGHIMFETGIVEREREIVFLSKAGELIVRSSGSWITMNFPCFTLTPMIIPDNLENIAGSKPLELYRADGWTLILLKSEDEVRKMYPDFKAMKDSPFGDLIVTAPSVDPEFDFCVRCFAPAFGIDEDPVTGAAHCALVPFWHNKTGRREFVSRQVSKRGGILKVALKDNRVEISGQAKTIFRAELFV